MENKEIRESVLIATIQGMLDDIPKSKRSKWIAKLNEMVNVKALPNLSWVGDETPALCPQCTKDTLAKQVGSSHILNCINCGETVMKS